MEEVHDYFLQKRMVLEGKLTSEKRMSKRLSLVRLLSFLVIVAGIYCFSAISPVFGGVLLLLGVVVFGVSLSKYLSLSKQIQHDMRHLEIIQHEIDSLSGNHANWNDGEDYSNGDHHFSSDLDVFGAGSLFQALNRVGLRIGRDRLAALLKNPSVDPAEILELQEANDELSGLQEWREEILIRSSLADDAGFDPKLLLKWSEEESNTKLDKIAPALFFLVPAYQVLNTVFYAMDFYSEFWFLVLFMVPLLLASCMLKYVIQEHKKVDSNHKQVVRLAELLDLVSNQDFQSEILRAIGDSGSRSRKAIRELSQVLELFDSRGNVFVAILGNAYFCWEVYCLWRLRRWHRIHRSDVGSWLDSIADLEAFNSFAAFTFRRKSESVRPQIIENGIDLVNLRHPLMVDTCVPNSVQIESQNLIVITGANMAGKSTFLRTVGVSLILAQNGCNVLASQFKFAPKSIFSSMRTSDSLQSSESYFYNELKRLQVLVKLLEAGDNVFVLLDEILKGTNSVDKAQGSYKFVEKLLNYSCTGLIATHDLSLCEIVYKHESRIENHYFDVEIGEDDLEFYYVLRKGICSNMNATFLMNKMGIID